MAKAGLSTIYRQGARAGNNLSVPKLSVSVLSRVLDEAMHRYADFGKEAFDLPPFVITSMQRLRVPRRYSPGVWVAWVLRTYSLRINPACPFWNSCKVSPPYLLPLSELKAESSRYLVRCGVCVH